MVSPAVDSATQTAKHSIMASSETETPQEKHALLARQLLDQADHEMMAGDLLQSSEKLWGATSHALKALCESRGWRHGKYAQREYAVKRLTAELNRPAILDAFRVAEACHANFYNDWLTAVELEENRQAIHRLVETILERRDHGDQ